jgi:hypothetical protein
MEMKPSEIRRQVLRDHETIRAMLATLESVAHGVCKGDRSLVGSMRLEAETLLTRLSEHMGWEDRYLRPALLEADAWGRERAAQLDRDHREQRELLEYSLGHVRDGGHPATVLARGLVDLVELLRKDMDHEESDLLDPRVLRDDVVGIDVETD